MIKMDSIKVAIKVRPLIKREIDENLPVQWVVQANTIASCDPESGKRSEPFHFDHIFDTNQSNDDVFNVVAKPIVEAAVRGINGTIFAYGQTSSGKTYTMMGDPECPGVIPQAIGFIFDTITNTYGREFLLRVSYIEIYNEKVNDLLNQESDGRGLKVAEDKNSQVTVRCKEEVVNCPENVLALMRVGDENRRTGETNMNKRSSRSHTIFRITIESRETESNSDGAVQVSQLNLVDLAGSERLKSTGATGDRFIEGRHINLSLLSLGQVIQQLSENQDSQQRFINYRNSKLTRILQGSLGGNAVTTIICAVTPAAFEETQNTLQFASRAKTIKNKPQVNEVVSDATLMKRYVKQLDKLKNELELTKSGKFEELESKLMEKDRLNQLLEQRIQLLKTQIVTGTCSPVEENSKQRMKRRRTWAGAAGNLQGKMLSYNLPPGLPSIQECDKSPEEPKKRRSIIQPMHFANQSFQTEFTDFELELINKERAADPIDVCNIPRLSIYVAKRPLLTVDQPSGDSSLASSASVTPINSPDGKINQTNSPGTPRATLRARLQFIIQDYNNLMKEHRSLEEFSRLEKQCIVEDSVEAAMVEHNKAMAELRELLATSEKARIEILEKFDDLESKSNKRISELEEELSEQLTRDRKNSANCESFMAELSQKSSEELVEMVRELFSCKNSLEEDNNKLETMLREKCREADDVKNDIRDLKQGIQQLNETINLLNSENTALTNRLTDEKEHSKDMEKSFQSTIENLNMSICAIKQEKLAFEMTMNGEEIEEKSALGEKSMVSKVSESAKNVDDSNRRINKLLAENRELSTCLMNKIDENEELRKKIKSKDHECNCSNFSISLSERNRLLESENIELSTNLMDKIEEYECLMDQYEKLVEASKKMPLEKSENWTNSDEKSSEIAPKVGDLLRFSLPDIEITSPGSRKPEKSFGNLLEASMRAITAQETSVHELEMENWRKRAEELAEKVKILEAARENNTENTCEKCSHHEELRENRKLLKSEIKCMNRTLRELETKFERENADSVILRSKACDELNLSVTESMISGNTNFDESLSVSRLEERVMGLSQEFESLEMNREKLADKYNEKCNEIDLLCEITARNSPNLSKDSGRTLDRLAAELSSLQVDQKNCKKKIASIGANLQRFKHERISFQRDIALLREEKSRLEEKLLELIEARKACESEKSELDKNGESLENLSTIQNGLEETEKSLKNAETMNSELEQTNRHLQNFEAGTSEVEDPKYSREELIEARKALQDFEKVKSELEAAKKSLENLGSMKSELQKAKESLNIVQNELEEAKKSLQISESMKSEFEEAQRHLQNFEAVKSELEDAKIAREELVEARKALQNFEIVKSELEAAKKSLENLESVESELEKAKKSLENFSFVQNELEEAKKSLKISESMKSEFEEAKRHLQNFEAVKSELEDAKRYLQNFEAVKSELEDAKIAREELVEARKALQNFEIVKSELEAAKKSLEDLESVKSELEKAKQSLENFAIVENELDEAKKSLQNSNTMKSELENAKIAREELTEARKALQDFEKVKSELEVAKKSLENLESVKSELKKAKESLENFSIVQMELEEAKKSLKYSEALKSELEQANKQLQDYEAVKSELQKARKSLDNFSIVQNELEEAKKSLKNSESMKSEFEEAKKYLHNFEAVKFELEDAKIVREELVEARKALKNFEKVEYELEAAKESLKHLESVKSELEKAKQSLENFAIVQNELDETKKSLENLESMKSVFGDAKIAREELIEARKALQSFEKVKSELEQAKKDCQELEEGIESTRQLIIKELMSLSGDTTSCELSQKTINELFNHFVKSIMSKEEELIKDLMKSFESKHRKLIDNKRQSMEEEKKAHIWSKELEADLEKAQQDLAAKESENVHLQKLLEESENLVQELRRERQSLLEKAEFLEADFTALQADFLAVRRQENREKSLETEKKPCIIDESVETREMELTAKLRQMEKEFRDKMQDLTSTIDQLKSQNIGMLNELDLLRVSEAQSKDLLEHKIAEFAKLRNSRTHAEEEFNRLIESNRLAELEIAAKNAQISEISNLLKVKCDKMSEYKTQLECIKPEYENLKGQLAERELRLEKCKTEFEHARNDLEGELAKLRDQLSLQKAKTSENDNKLIESSYKIISLEREIARLTQIMKENFENSKIHIDAINLDNEKLQASLESEKSLRSCELQTFQTKYDDLMKEKCKLMTQLEAEKLCAEQLKNEAKKLNTDIEALRNENLELDKEMEDMVTVINDLRKENVKLDDQLHAMTTRLVGKSEMEITTALEEYAKVPFLLQQLESEKLRATQLENKIQMMDIELQGLRDKNKKLAEEITDLTRERDDLRFHCKMDRGEAKSNAQNSYSRAGGSDSSGISESRVEQKNREKSEKNGHFSIDSRRRLSRNELFNVNRSFDPSEVDMDIDTECRCADLRKRISAIEKESALKDAKVATLELQIQSRVFPHIRKCNDLEDVVASLKRKNKLLEAEMAKLQAVQRCERCTQLEKDKRNQDTQTMPTPIYMSGTSSGILADAQLIAKIEKDKAMLKEVCRKRGRQVQELTERLKKIEQSENTENPPNTRQALKENMPISWNNQSTQRASRLW